MLLLYLLFLIVVAALVGAAVYVKGAGKGKRPIAGPIAVMSIGGAEVPIACFIYRRLYYSGMGIFAYAIVSVILLAAVWLLVDRLLKPRLSAEGSFAAVKKTVVAMTVAILLSCLACVGAIGVLDNSYSGVDDAMQYSDYASEEAFDGGADTLAFAQDEISCGEEAFYDGEFEWDDAEDAGYAEDVADDDPPAFAPGISDWSDGACYFAGPCGFRGVHFFINDGDRCIRVMTSPADMLNLYAYTGTSDGWHRFRKYRLAAGPLKMETKDLMGNPMTINIPVIAGSGTKYRKEYLDSYVLVAEDASEFVGGGESFPAVDEVRFWRAWNAAFGENWHLAAGGGGGSHSASQGVEGSTSDYSVGKCKYCGGTGRCSTCGGSGFVDFMGDVQKCPSCRGFGKCFNCGGSGLQL